MRFRKTLTLLLLAPGLVLALNASARQKPVAPGFSPAHAALKGGATTALSTPAKPFTQEQVSNMVRAGLGEDSGAKLIEQRGIDFAPSEDFIRTLKAAGARGISDRATHRQAACVRIFPLSHMLRLAIMRFIIPAGGIYEAPTTCGNHLPPRGIKPAVFARQWALDVPKGATVVVKVPIKFWKSESSSFSTGTPIFNVDASPLLAKQDWQTAGLPYFGEFVVTKVFEFKPLYKLKYTDVELRNSTTWVKLRFEPGSDLSSGFQSLTFTGTWKEFEAGDYFKNVVFGTVGSTIFTGPLSRISDSAKLALLRIAGTGLATISSESYKDKVYIGFHFPPSGTEYNSIKLNESARAATVINSRLTMLKDLAVLGADTGVDGIKISETIFYRNFVSETRTNSDSLQIYAPLGAIKQFSSADITSQQFVDQCVVILNSNRIQVLLSNAS